ncbi:MAG: PH domain-containing protein [Zavarzinella sp.]
MRESPNRPQSSYPVYGGAFFAHIVINELSMAAATQQKYPDPSLKDLYWGGYSGWALWPLALLCAVLAPVIFYLVPWLFERWGFNHANVAWICINVDIVLLSGCAALWLYRSIYYVYRLTPEYLFIDRGYFHRPVPKLPLKTISEICITSPRWYQIAGTGTIRITCTGGRIEYLTGVFNPHACVQRLNSLICN